MSVPYHGTRLDAKAAAKVAERMSKPVPESAIAKRHRAGRRMYDLHLKPMHMRGAEETPAWDKSMTDDKEIFVVGERRSSDDKIAQNYRSGFTTGEWIVGPDGNAVWKDNQGFAPVSGEKSVVAIEGRIHNTPVGSATVKARPDSPFKRAKANTTQVVIVRK